MPCIKNEDPTKRQHRQCQEAMFVSSNNGAPFSNLDLVYPIPTLSRNLMNQQERRSVHSDDAVLSIIDAALSIVELEITDTGEDSVSRT
mmetsp:Transcript_20374/g.50652  ORF Transcript_20374/g.50652 Transcript_20374/m.50652 type:complete len:89 (-) Transcript_20374:295-561(-)